MAIIIMLTWVRYPPPLHSAFCQFLNVGRLNKFTIISDKPSVIGGGGGLQRVTYMKKAHFGEKGQIPEKSGLGLYSLSL